MAKTQKAVKYSDIQNNPEGFVTVGAFSPCIYIGNAMKNAEEIVRIVNTDSKLKSCQLVVTPELSITGYTCQDMFFNEHILGSVGDALMYIRDNLRAGVVLSVGAPLVFGKQLFNCSILIKNGQIISVTPKTYLANYAEFYEDRWFTAYNPDKHGNIDKLGYWVTTINKVNDKTGDCEEMFSVGCEICEDLWAADPVSTHLALAGANIIVNNSASNETIGKASFRRNLVKMQSAKTLSVYVYCSAGLTESSQDVVFGGHNIIAENGKILAESDLYDINSWGVVVATVDLGAIGHDRLLNKTFSTYSNPRVKTKETSATIVPIMDDTEIHRTVSITPFLPSGITNVKMRCRELFDIQVAGLTSRLISRGNSKIVIGVSGGLDSTLALLVAYEAITKLHRTPKDIVGVTMPCFGTTSRTKDNAIKLMKELDCTMMEVNITDSVKQHLRDIGLPETDRSVAFENAQARERTQVLMDIGNMVGGFVLGTGDMSELALGWCTYNADQMSMYNTNGSIPKTLVRPIVDTMGNWITNSGVINDILDTPVSPELLPPSDDGSIAQLTEESVGPYVFNDFFLWYHIRYGFGKQKIMDLAKIACMQNDMSYNQACKWIDKFYKRFFAAQFKRNPMPDGVKVGSVSLNPRGDWRCPSEFDSSAFLD